MRFGQEGSFVEIIEYDSCYGPTIAFQTQSRPYLFPEDSRAETDGKILWLQATEFMPATFITFRLWERN